MASDAIEIAADGTVRVSGRLTFETVESVQAAARAAVSPEGRRGATLTFDLGSVEHADSAGLALLVEWRRAVHHGGGRIHFRATPPALRAIASVCGVDGHLFGPRSDPVRVEEDDGRIRDQASH